MRMWVCQTLGISTIQKNSIKPTQLNKNWFTQHKALSAQRYLLLTFLSGTQKYLFIKATDMQKQSLLDTTCQKYL